MDEQQRTKIANYLGLAQRAGLIAAGDAKAGEALRKGRACLLVLAEDIAPTVEAELLALVADGLPLLRWPDMNDLGRIVGKSRRGALALTDPGFTAAILRVLQTTNK